MDLPSILPSRKCWHVRGEHAHSRKGATPCRGQCAVSGKDNAVLSCSSFAANKGLKKSLFGIVRQEPKETKISKSEDDKSSQNLRSVAAAAAGPNDGFPSRTFQPPAAAPPPPAAAQTTDEVDSDGDDRIRLDDVAETIGQDKSSASNQGGSVRGRDY